MSSSPPSSGVDGKECDHPLALYNLFSSSCKFIVVRVGPKENYDAEDRNLLKYSLYADEYYYALFNHPDSVQKFETVFIA
jgi:hypothetical protein